MYTLKKFRNEFMTVLYTWAFKYGAPVQICTIIKLPTGRVHVKKANIYPLPIRVGPPMVDSIHLHVVHTNADHASSLLHVGAKKNISGDTGTCN